MKTLTTVLFITTTLLLGCASTGSKDSTDSQEKITSTLDDMELQTSTKPVRIRDYQVRSWKYIDHYNLIIEAGFKENYLVSLRTPCVGLDGAFSIGFTSSAGTFDKFEDIVVSRARGFEERCPIQEIVKLEPMPKNSEEGPAPE